ncbi:MAG: hypothetical protein ACREIJ_00260 [Nitrospiraceae bacterium]
MRLADQRSDTVLNLRVGEIVEVRGAEEILATLDERRTLEALPFMPEMLKYCGRRFRVFKRADRTCDTIEYSGMRRMNNAIHLENVRCDGEGHGGCQAGCLVFWKEAWLKRVPKENGHGRMPILPHSSTISGEGNGPSVAVEAARARLMPFARQEPGPDDPDGTIYSCQSTELRKATSPITEGLLTQCLRDVASGTLSPWDVLRFYLFKLFNLVQRRRRGVMYPCISGTLTKTPSARIDLQPDELVQVKGVDEIVNTLDVQNKNRGLSFDVEMAKYCGGHYRVLRRVERVINEKTGQMMRFPNECVVLDGVVCSGEFHWLCPRSIFPFWREIWLGRVKDGSSQSPSRPCVP